jgi:hypothetical protein
MCRWMVYMGKPIIMADIVTRPQNSIGAFSPIPCLLLLPQGPVGSLRLFRAAVHQSRHSPYLPFVHGHHGEAKVMNTAINGDGFGVGWYAPPASLSTARACAARLDSYTLPRNPPGTITSAQSPAYSSRPFPPGTAPTSKPSPPTCSAFPPPPCYVLNNFS